MVINCPWYQEMSPEEEAVPEEPHDQTARMKAADKFYVSDKVQNEQEL